MSPRIHAAVKTTKLDPAQAYAFVDDPAHGAVSSFVGMVRNHHEGLPVTGMSYDAHETLAEKALRDICLEAGNFWHGVHIFVEHAKGTLKVGDISVVIAVSAPHRADAFDACRFVIEEIKKRVPVWKNEHYADGGEKWLVGQKLESQPAKSGGCGGGTGCGCGGK